MSDGLRRSWFLVPPLDKNQVAEALSYRPDVVVMDLVELVAEERKPEAHSQARSAIEDALASGTQVFAQVDKNHLAADLEAVVWRGLTGVVVSRLESPQEVKDCEGHLAQLERQRGLPPNSLQVVASLDTALGNQRAMEIVTASDRVWGVTLGRADLEMDLRPEPNGEIHLLPYLMQRLIIIARAARVAALGAWWRPPARGLLASAEETYQAAARGRALGFKGSLCILGPQVEALNRGYGRD